MPAARRRSASSSAGPSTAGAAGRAAGGSSTSRSCTWATTCWCRTSPAGDASACRSYPDAPWFDARARLGLRGAEPGHAAARSDRQARHLRRLRASAHLWLVDPDERTLEAFARRDGAWVLIAAMADEAEVRIAPFDAVAFPLAALWTGLTPRSGRGFCFDAVSGSADAGAPQQPGGPSVPPTARRVRRPPAGGLPRVAGRAGGSRRSSA